MVLRTLAVGTGVAVFLSLFGAFGRPWPQLIRDNAPFFIYSWIGALMGLAGARLCWRLGLWPRGPVVVGLATGLMMAVPMTFAVWIVQGLLFGRPPRAAALPEVIWQVLLVCVGASVLAILISGRMSPAPAPAGNEPPKFLERIPLKLRGGELWAVEAQDHYLRLHTSKGQGLILMRLADAIDELAGIEGAQVHRSWWVARDAIADARRGDGRATLTLKDGSEVPVSRTYARQLRTRNWI
ncbi:MAG: LytTR family transcriptional regulator [Alphaproteobacteria bacterium]|nr:LytTR family transcriptional regulator [Alphaproteobacteria bacterium]